MEEKQEFSQAFIGKSFDAVDPPDTDTLFSFDLHPEEKLSG